MSEGLVDLPIDQKPVAQLLVTLSKGHMLQASLAPEDEDWTTLAREGMQMILEWIRRKK